MPRKTPEEVSAQRPQHEGAQASAPFWPLLHHPNLWHLNRHSVAGGVAVGLFTGLIPGPVQMLFAAIFAVVFRVNLPVAVFTTLLHQSAYLRPLYMRRL